ncbi:hypothetical protein Sjap_002146 [Stephania japonica]|uniref:Uncharacterized protein n=1 Tax=Stephania japonica TaxID=461633 RepID=A0AAP0KLH7_9MAGN
MDEPAIGAASPFVQDQVLDFGGDAQKGVSVAASSSSSASSLSSCSAICLEKIELQEIALVKGKQGLLSREGFQDPDHAGSSRRTPNKKKEVKVGNGRRAKRAMKCEAADKAAATAASAVTAANTAATVTAAKGTSGLEPCSWYYAIGNKVDLATWPSTEVFELFNRVENNIHKCKTIWDQTVENHRVNELSKPNKIKIQMQEMGLSGLFTDMSPNEVAEQAATIVSQINLLLGTILYERSILEFKLGLPQWEYSVETAYKEFGLAGATSTDLAVKGKNHCSHETGAEGNENEKLLGKYRFFRRMLYQLKKLKFLFYSQE